MISVQTNADVFLAEIKQQPSILQRDFKKFRDGAVMRLAHILVKNTPKDTRFAASRWFAVADRVVQAPPPYTRNPKAFFNTSDSITRIASELRSIPPLSTVILINSVKYIHVLENGLFVPPNPGPSKDKRPHRFGRILVRDGFSTQAPRGIGQESVDEFLLLYP